MTDAAYMNGQTGTEDKRVAIPLDEPDATVRFYLLVNSSGPRAALELFDWVEQKSS